MKKSKSAIIAAALAIITLLGLHLRLEAVRFTEVDTPVRADARGYLSYALNLQHFAIFSSSDRLFLNDPTPPSPDAYRTPIYPWFLRLLLDDPLSTLTLHKVELVQALLSTLTIVLTYALCSAFLNRSLSLLSALLTAISPHLIITNVFILTETLFCFLMTAFLWSLSRWKQHPSPALFLSTGLLLGLASLTRPTLQGFIVMLIPLVLFYSPVERARRATLLVTMAFALPMMVWTIRNLITLGVASDNTFLISNLYQGTYPWLLYDNRPETLAYAYRFDPRAAEISATLPTIGAQFLRHLRERPLDYLAWYVIGKPIYLFSWTQFEGNGDILIYPLLRNPYNELVVFRISYLLMRNLHNALVVLSVFGTIFAWLPRPWTRMSLDQCFIARTLAALTAYFVILHSVLNPLPRYAIPLRPVTYATAMFALWYLGRLVVIRTASRNPLREKRSQLLPAPDAAGNTATAAPRANCQTRAGIR